MKTAHNPRNNRVLIIDDNRAIHADFRKILCPDHLSHSDLDDLSQLVLGAEVKPMEIPSFELESAFQGQEGCEMVAKALEAGRRYALAFMDMRMPPGWDGMETIQQLWKIDPDIQVVVCTAFSDYSWEEMIVRVGATDRFVVLKKPFDAIEVQQLANALTEKWWLLQNSKLKLESLEIMVASRTEELEESNRLLVLEIEQKKIFEEQLRQSQKMEAIGQLAGGIAHDFNNLLTIIQGYADLVLLREKANPATAQALRQICSAAQKAAHLTRQLLTFSRKQIKEFCTLDLNVVLADMDQMLQRILGEHIRLGFPAPAPLPCVLADRGMIEQIILNLAVNARDAMPGGGSLTFATEVVEISKARAASSLDARPGSFVCLSVTDDGSGIPPEILPHIFEPFFTTKDVGQGTGLGLATVYGIVKQHQGWIEVDTARERGTVFRILLPIENASHTMAPVSEPAQPVQNGTETILLVEDQEELRDLVSEILRGYGYQVVAAASGAEAVKVWESKTRKVDLLLTDMVMPEGISGRDLSNRLHRQQPDLKVIYMSGYCADLTDNNFLANKDVHFLPKPYLPQELGQLVRKTLDSASSRPVPSQALALA